jgi:hypothetical protein
LLVVDDDDDDDDDDGTSSLLEEGFVGFFVGTTSAGKFTCRFRSEEDVVVVVVAELAVLEAMFVFLGNAMTDPTVSFMQQMVVRYFAAPLSFGKKVRHRSPIIIIIIILTTSSITHHASRE